METTGKAPPVYRLKRDKYRKARGGRARLIDVYCAACDSLVLVYQKDLPRGLLKRCYIDRIFYPDKYAALQKDPKVRGPKDLPALACAGCNALLGTPILYTKHGERRLAYGMLHGRFTKKISTHGIGRER